MTTPNVNGLSSMGKEVIVARGVFSTLYIAMNDKVMNNLAIIPSEDNPLAKLEDRLNKILLDFEKTYFKINQPKIRRAAQ